MMPLTPESVRKLSRGLPGWPVAITDILNTLDNPDANLGVLIKAIHRDPVITARVLWLVNTAAMRGQRESEVTDITTAVSLAGLQRLRHVVLISSLSTFGQAAQVPSGTRFWTHSIAVGVCAEELALHLDEPVTASKALVAGLLHDVGQLCLHQADRDGLAQCQMRSKAERTDISGLEQAHFGVTHGQVGAWLATQWQLPADLIDALASHHAPPEGASSPLVDIVHVAEVLSHALQLGGEAVDCISHVSASACERLGLVWDEDSQALFGRMEARTRHATLFFSALPAVPVGKTHA